MGLKLVQNFDGRFALEPAAQAALFALLTSPAFLQHVAQAAHCTQVNFTERLFQPVPYSPTTPKGMPAEFEPFHGSDDYLIINVPPQFMMQAKVFQPSRLCAIYQKVC